MGSVKCDTLLFPIFLNKDGTIWKQSIDTAPRNRLKGGSRHFVTCSILDQCMITVSETLQYWKPNMIIIVNIDSKVYQNKPLCLYSVLLHFTLHFGIFVSADSTVCLISEIHFCLLCDSVFILSVCWCKPRSERLCPINRLSSGNSVFFSRQPSKNLWRVSVLQTASCGIVSVTQFIQWVCWC